MSSLNRAFGIEQFKTLSIAISVLSIFLTASIFQNCAGGMDANIPTNLPVNHPSVEGPQAIELPVVQNRLLIADRDYLSSVFRDIFDSPEATAAERQSLAAYMQSEIIPQQHLLGRSCNPLETGDSNDCMGAASNMALRMRPESSSGREAIRIQLCRRVLSNGVHLSRLLGKVRGSGITPSADSLAALVHLFVPSAEGNEFEQLIAYLLKFDSEMAQNNEAVTTRWQVLSLTACEATDWEIL